jgi:hypothetical protein
MMRSFVIASLLLLVGTVTGCGGHGEGDIDNVIGQSCTSDRDCDARCYMDPGDFPGGICSLPCSSDNDCPSDTYCMKKSEGVCLFACPEFDCSRLGAGWSCRDKERLNGGTVSVCIGD